jgi:hypothetical protein
MSIPIVQPVAAIDIGRTAYLTIYSPPALVTGGRSSSVVSHRPAYGGCTILKSGGYDDGKPHAN